MAKAVNFEAWQLENRGAGFTGKNKGGFQTNTDAITDKIKVDPFKSLRGKKKPPLVAKKRKQGKGLTVFQFLKNNGMCITHITIKTPTPWITKQGRKVFEQVIEIDRFMWPNQIKRDYPNAVSVFYSKPLLSSGGHEEDILFSDVLSTASF